MFYKSTIGDDFAPLRHRQFSDRLYGGDTLKQVFCGISSACLVEFAHK